MTSKKATNWFLREYEARLECIWRLVCLDADRDMVRAAIDRDGYDVVKAEAVRSSLVKDCHGDAARLLALFGGELHKVPWPLALHWHSAGQIMTARHYTDGTVEYRA